ncbi:SAN1 [[Candida] subhashii]|uniref:SAN1 n=1 Tax=[Candida] subhashii TaxID=561895 RepID=A0A8J5UWS2_9ASCO|nr:SAN1 [[Candida] subhashii]KAG7661849.1 SAN1 [[Candida] subhashii]
MSTPNNNRDSNNYTDNNNNDNNNTNDTTDNNGNPQRREVRLFDRILDTLLSAQRRLNRPQRQQTEQQSQQPSGDSANVNMEQQQQQNQEQPPASQPTTSQPSTAPADAMDSEESQTINTEDDPNQAIIITVNYVFSDQNQPNNPNRAGSLVMSLPNNASNRDPRVIQEFIRLATQMAYSSILTGLSTQSGITVKTFTSFPGVKLEDLGESKTCSICFELFDALKEEEQVDDQDMSDHTVSHKKRRLADSTGLSTATSSNIRPDDSSTQTEQQGPIFLSEYSEDFGHIPVKMPCGHIFGKDCLCEWLKGHATCPLCRFSVQEQDEQEAAAASAASASAARRRRQQNQHPSTLTIFTIPTESPVNVASPFTNITIQNNIHDEPVNEPVPTAAATPTTATQPTTGIPQPPHPVITPMAPHPVRTVSTQSPPPGTPTSPTDLHHFGIDHPSPSSSGTTTTPIRRFVRPSGGTVWQEDNSPNEPLSHVIGFLRRQRRAQRDPGIIQPSSQASLFPSGVSSRRTESGGDVTTTLHQNSDDGNNNDNDYSSLLHGVELRNLFNDSPMSSRDEPMEDASGSSSENRGINEEAAGSSNNNNNDDSISD